MIAVFGLSAQSTPTGVWNTGQENSQIKITKVDGSYVGYLISSENPNAKIGRQMLKDFQAVGDKWEGKLYAPRKGEWFDAVLRLKGDLLIVKVGSGFWSKTLEWKKE